MATIRDVARMCGLSVATVSYVVNNTRTVRPQTRERVLTAVRRLNYSPSAVARGLSRKRMDTIGVVYPPIGLNHSPITDPYYGPVLDGILTAAREARQNTTLFTGEVWDNVADSLPVYRDGRSDGLLLIGPRADSPVVDALCETNLPFVVISAHSNDPRLSRVDVDNQKAAQEMVQTLIHLGHQRIALVSEPRSMGIFIVDRILGYTRALEEAGLPVRPEWIRCADTFALDMAEMLDPILTLPVGERPTALFCTRDSLAYQVLPALRARGLRIPQDISLCGFDDFAPSTFTEPPLATVRQPLHEIGRTAAHFLLERITTPTPAGELRTLPTEILLRESVAKL